MYLLGCERKENPSLCSLELLVWDTFVLSKKSWQTTSCRVASDGIISNLPISRQGLGGFHSWDDGTQQSMRHCSCVSLLWSGLWQRWADAVWYSTTSPSQCWGRGAASGRTGWTTISNLCKSVMVSASFLFSCRRWATLVLQMKSVQVEGAVQYELEELVSGFFSCV